MAEKIYEGSTILLYVDLWDKRISEEKPLYRANDAWLSEGDLEEITLTIRKPNDAEDEVLTLSEEDISATSSEGRFQARFDLDDGAGTYVPIVETTTTDGYVDVEVGRRIKARSLPV